jgi:EAL domain-containing protein (putative c-di-GMP-specific phosphodiesterase class I)
MNAVKGRVLVLDDEPSLLEVFADLLDQAGYQVATATTPAKALAQLEDQTFDVVVSDIMMPGMSGVALLKEVRRRDPDLPVLLATGNPSLETAIQAVEAGAVQYLLKPLSADALIGAVERAARLRRMALLRREALSYLTSHPLAGPELATLNSMLDRVLASLWIAYQPIVRPDGSVFGHEALLRCDDRALPGPAAVFEAAERAGRVVEVGRAVRRAVATALEDGRLPSSVFVNIHSLDLTDHKLISPDGPLSRWAANVVIEVTERASLDTVPDARSRIRTLREMGFRIAVDDLGAGYAGLSSFAALEPEVVKLDIALVRGVDSEPVKQKLIASIASLCRDLGILVVAEGVETPAEREMLVRLECDLLQGYLIGRPEREPATAPALGSA